MLQLDDRTGSGDLAPLLRELGVPLEVTRLEYGDAALIGNGPEGIPFPVGVEIKKVSDVLACICDGRFAGHQLPGLVQCYQRVYLVIEGAYRADLRTGRLQWPRGPVWADARVGNRGFAYKDLDTWLLTLEMKAGVRVRRTYDRRETTRFLADLWNWCCGKEWEDHLSHLAFDLSSDIDSALLVRPNLVRRLAKELPGIGWKKSQAVAQYFDSSIEMVMAGEQAWRQIPGIGKELARRIVAALEGGK
jgi:ERCC4-type nuclease